MKKNIKKLKNKDFEVVYKKNTSYNIPVKYHNP